MTFGEITVALKARLVTVAGSIPVAWPGKDFTPGQEYIEFAHAPTQRIDNTGTGGATAQEGIVLMTAVVRAGIGETRAEQIADIIRAGFPYPLRLTAGSAKVLINRPPEPAPGFTDGTYYRIPVRVRYITE